MRVENLFISRLSSWVCTGIESNVTQESIQDPVVCYSLACRSRHLEESVSLLASLSRQVTLSTLTRDRFAGSVSHSL